MIEEPKLLVVLPWRRCFCGAPQPTSPRHWLVCCSAAGIAYQNWTLVEQAFASCGLTCQRVEANGKAINEAVRSASFEKIWFHDPDLWLPVSDIVKQLSGRDTLLAIKPYRCFYQTTRPETYHFWETGGVPSIDGRRSMGQAFGRFSFIVQRELWLALGGVSQEFEGPEEVGTELGQRLVLTSLKPDERLEFSGWTLHRSVSDEERAVRQRDKDRVERPALLSESASEFAAGLRRQLQCGVSNAYVPTKLPCSLPGQLWALTCYFNPSNYRSKPENFRAFRAGLAANQVPLCLVELAFDNQPFVFTASDAELLIQIRGGAVCWQKERLLNVGLEALPAQCDKVAWLDGDILFENPNWAQETAQLLESYAIVQPFRWSVRLLPGETRAEYTQLPLGCGDNEAHYGVADGVARHGLESLNNYHLHGHTGYAWAGRRSILQKHGFYQYNPLGNADLNMACAMFSGCLNLKLERFSASSGRHLMAWAERFYGDVQGSVACAEGAVFHLWHGSKQNRLYEKRLTVLVENDFQPEDDLKVSSNGAFEWATDKPALHQWCKDYFVGRQEDAQM